MAWKSVFKCNSNYYVSNSIKEILTRMANYHISSVVLKMLHIILYSIILNKRVLLNCVLYKNKKIILLVLINYYDSKYLMWIKQDARKQTFRFVWSNKAS